MTKAREWTEELVAQYFEIQGFLVLPNLPTVTGKRGGRAEADVVAFRQDAPIASLWSKGMKVEAAGPQHAPVVHDIEVGTYYESASSIADTLCEKFTDKRREIVLGAIRKHLGLQAKGRLFYQPSYVDAAWLSEKVIAALRMADRQRAIHVTTIEEVIKDVPRAIEEWSKRSETEKGTMPQLPRAYDLLKVAEACYWVWSE